MMKFSNVFSVAVLYLGSANIIYTDAFFLPQRATTTFTVTVSSSSLSSSAGGGSSGDTTTTTTTSTVTSTDNDKEEETTYLLGLWEELKSDNNILLEHIQGIDENVITKELVEDTLQTALQQIKLEEEFKNKQVLEFHKVFDLAVKEEMNINKFINDENIKSVAQDGFIQSRLHATQKEELQALEDETISKIEYEELRKSEKYIKKTLHELKTKNTKVVTKAKTRKLKLEP